mgnify:FL=1
MKIKKLIVRKTKPSEEVIREIQFKEKGLNLIIDDTPESLRESGNSVGKSTAIKIIDLCLGAKSVRELYYDSDTRSENVVVKDFLEEYKVQAELILIDENKREYSIKRDLFLRGKKYIFDEPYSEQDFWDELKKIIFGLKEPRPTFRQLIPKFVRVENTAEERMIKFLPIMTGSDVYDTIYCFLFQIYSDELLSKKGEITEKLFECQKTIQMLEKSKSISSLSVLKQSLEIINSDLKDLYDKRNKLSYMDEYREELDSKRKLTLRINDLQEKMELVEFEISNIENSIVSLSKEKSEINIQILQAIYQEAKSYIPKLQKNFEDMISFHNSMIQNRIDFIQKQLNVKKELLEQYSSQLANILEQKEKITIEALDEGLLDELNMLNRKIEDLSLKKGEIKQSIQLLEEQEAVRQGLNKELLDIQNQMENDGIDEKIKKFNQFFSDYCDKLYGEKYLLAYNENWKEEKKFPVSIASLGGNVGTGKKKAVIVAFDLAYMQYSIHMGIKVPQFVIHDKMENTHINQIKTIFEICEEIDGQYIIPILRERIDKVDQKYVQKAKVLELSTNNKFFGI